MPSLLIHHLVVIIHFAFFRWLRMKHSKLNYVYDVSDFDELEFIDFGRKV